MPAKIQAGITRNERNVQGDFNTTAESVGEIGDEAICQLWSDAMELDKVVMAKLTLSRESLKPVTYHDLRLLAVQMVKDIGIDNFTASRSF